MLQNAPWWQYLLFCPFSLYKSQRYVLTVWAGLFFFLESTSWFVYASLSGSVSVATRFHPPFYISSSSFWIDPAHSMAWHHRHGPVAHVWWLVSLLFLSTVHAWFYTDICQSTGTALWAVTVPAGKSIPLPEGFGAGNQIKFQSPVVALLIEREVALLLPGAGAKETLSFGVAVFPKIMILRESGWD